MFSTDYKTRANIEPTNTMLSKQNCENWVSYEQKPRSKMVWVKKNQCPQIPIEVWLIILNYASPVSKIKLCSTCIKLYKSMERQLYFYNKYIESYICDLWCEYDDRISTTTITHLITNIPIERQKELIVFLRNYRMGEKLGQKLHLDNLNFILLPNNFCCYEIPYTRFQYLDIVFKDFILLVGPDPFCDSEKIKGRHEILDSLPFQPIHSAYNSEKVTTTLFHPDMTSIYTMILCTGPIIFSKDRYF